jgi:hypothetical protein
MERSLLLRELGRQQRDVSLNADATLVRRMQQSSLDGHIAAVTSCAFNDNGTLLVSRYGGCIHSASLQTSVGQWQA